ncbi:RibD family protein [Candidatus Oscillochloris fontis]|uniref:RibD family protein n=1 Tax=Candidatus Oscillochloris fontis TaxID=2496868 RepID=UPI00101D008F|nr:dihydrofolate reductase family protein [Candidatus Oscillochloris fontis]
MNPIGPGSAYTLLFDDAPHLGVGLPEAAQAIYASNWYLPPAHADRPYTFTNFVASHDGRISFAEPGRSGGGAVSRCAPHDTWLMGLLRARADAILTGAGTLQVARRHLWTPTQAFSADAQFFADLRLAEGRTPIPLLVVVTSSGDLPANAAALRGDPQPVLIATTPAGATRAYTRLGERPGVSYHISRSETVDLIGLCADLRQHMGVRSLLSEGGAMIYGTLVAQRLLDETFLTNSPIIIGSPPGRPPRPSLIEGVGFSPDDPPRLRLLSLRRAGDYLFQRLALL